MPQIEFVKVKRNEYSSTSLEEMVRQDLGYPMDKDWFDQKLAENTVRKNFDSFVNFSYTNDGMQISGKNATELSDPEYCIVYVSFNDVLSGKGAFHATDNIDKWNLINEALIFHFFKQ